MASSRLVRTEKCPYAGFVITYYTTVSDQTTEVKRLTNGKGLDFVVNSVGPASIPENIGFLRQCGRLVRFPGRYQWQLKAGSYHGVMMMNAAVK